MNKIGKLAIFSVWLLTGQAVAAQKVALVIGNSQYQQGKPLTNPVNDAIDIEARFKQLGYSTILLKNATHQQMLAGLERFKQQLNGSDVGVFYYAGHGVELKRYNYLVPVDATMDNELSIKYQTLQLDDVANVLNSSGVKSALIVLDACRDNPFKAFSRSESRGLQRMNRDTVGDLKIIYAAQEGQVAKDGNGRNGVFTSEFLRYMGEPLSYPFFFDKVKQGVIAKSGGEQRPSEQGEISPYFSFVAQVEAPALSKLEPRIDGTFNAIEASLREQLQGSGIGIQRQGDGSILLPFLPFSTAQATIKPDFFNALNLISLVLKKYNKTIVTVSGHTSNVGRDDANLKLSQDRANSVAQYLSSQGVSSSRIYAIGLGETEPIADNATEHGRTLNGRVELKIRPYE